MAFQHGMLMRLSIMLLAVLVPAATTVVATTRAIATQGGEEIETAIMAVPGCQAKCGDLTIPYPFGIGDRRCYFGPRFEITCNKSDDDGPTVPRLMKTRMLVTNISLEDGELQIMQLVNRVCYNDTGASSDSEDQSKGALSVIPPYTISDEKNRMFVVGCDTWGELVGSLGDQNYTTGCISKCYDNPGDSVDKNIDTCSGLGCCRTKIPPSLNKLTLRVGSYYNHTKVNHFDPCGFAFVAQKVNFTFDNTSLKYLNETPRVPLVLDWKIGAESCDFACKGNSTCNNTSSGYICRCKDGYQGNPYLEHSCRDINECDLNSTLCKHGKCKNQEGNYTCVCDSGYKILEDLDDIRCIKVSSVKPLKISLGVSLSFSVLLVGIFWIYRKQRKSHLEYLKLKYFEANGGELLQKETASFGETANFTEEKVKDATHNYDESKKVGEGRYGIVYKGILKVGDQRKQRVAIKKSKFSVSIHQNQITSPIDDQKQITGKKSAAQEQFFNEITALCKINHKNVVRLIGRCLDIRKPILVYEFMCKGTLYENIHGKDGKKPSPLPLADQLKIAAEAAEALAYLHHDISPPIKHGDVNTSNILLDGKCTAKLSGFGASRPAARKEDENQASKSNTTITEKSDVYSFGLVLAELLTGIKREDNLEKIFIALVEGDKLGRIFDEKIVEGHFDEVKKAGDLAIECLESKEKEGHWPSMKDVASKLQGLVQSMKQHPSGGGPSASSAIMTSTADSSIMEITPHGDGR